MSLFLPIPLIFSPLQELYTILETREFESRYHHELQEMWYRAHYHEAEKIRARPLGECWVLQSPASLLIRNWISTSQQTNQPDSWWYSQSYWPSRPLDKHRWKIQFIPIKDWCFWSWQVGWSLMFTMPASTCVPCLECDEFLMQLSNFVSKWAWAWLEETRHLASWHDLPGNWPCL